MVPDTVTASAKAGKTITRAKTNAIPKPQVVLLIICFLRLILLVKVYDLEYENKVTKVLGEAYSSVG
jgi:hypothetical protein